MPVSLDDQIRCVRRELALRKAVYSKRVRAGAMKPNEARREYDAMQAVHDTLTLLQESDPPNSAA